MPVDGRPRPARDPDGYAELLCRIHPVGTAGDCAASMAATAQNTGIDHLVCMVEGASDPAAVQENIARLGAEVLPLLPGRGSPPVPGPGAAAAPADGERGGTSQASVTAGGEPPSRFRAIVIRAGAVIGHPPYCLPAVARTIAADLAAIQPAHAAYFKASAAAFTASLAAWNQAIATFKAAHPGTPVATTEPVADYMLQAAGTDNLTPWAFQADIMNGAAPRRRTWPPRRPCSPGIR